MKKTIALAGNPNSGKTTLFNHLTGARQRVGNYPGVTVERKEGTYLHGDDSFSIIDLPGTYSLSAYSLEEVVARDYLVEEKPDLVVVILDASNLERNLYLLVQIMELGLPILAALNMMDVAQKRGIHIDVSALSKLFQIPFVPIVARHGEGCSQLMEEAKKLVSQESSLAPLSLSYGDDIDLALSEMSKKVEEEQFLSQFYPPFWVALKYLEEDSKVLEQGRKENASLSESLAVQKDKVRSHIQKTLDTSPEAIITDHRYGFIRAILKQQIITFQHDMDRLYISDIIDKVATHRFFGPIIMGLVIYILYTFTFSFSEVPVSWLESFFGWLGSLAESSLPEGLFKSMIISGVIDGVGGVLGFVPLIMFMFLGISFIEDSGYLARISFMMDRVLRVFGLHGNSIMGYIVSGGIAGGCAVPGIMATRTLKSTKERLATLLTVPFMNCGAKIPIFALLVAAFFNKNEALMMFIITLIAWSGALVVAKVLRMTVVKGEATPFVMELPPYRLPTLRGILIHTWERTFQYIKKAGTTILSISIILWAMMTFPKLSPEKEAIYQSQKDLLLSQASAEVQQELSSPDFSSYSNEAKELAHSINKIENALHEESLKNSFAGRVGTLLTPISSWSGFDWKTNIALIGGFAAKEVMVSTLGTAYSLGEVDPEESQSLSETLASSPDWSPVKAFCLILFTIFYAPCLVTIVCIVKESGTWKWGIFAIVFNTAVAFFFSTLTFQLSRFF